MKFIHVGFCPALFFNQTAELGKAAPDFIFLKDFAAPECCTTSSMYCAIFFEKLLPE